MTSESGENAAQESVHKRLIDAASRTGLRRGPFVSTLTDVSWTRTEATDG